MRTALASLIVTAAWVAPLIFVKVMRRRRAAKAKAKRVAAAVLELFELDMELRGRR